MREISRCSKCGKYCPKVFAGGGYFFKSACCYAPVIKSDSKKTVSHKITKPERVELRSEI